MQELKISEFSFHEFLERFQEAVLQGYRLDLESNERFPQKYGSHLEVTLVTPISIVETLELPATLVTEPDVPVEVSVEEPVTEEPVTRTRKSKAVT